MNQVESRPVTVTNLATGQKAMYQNALPVSEIVRNAYFQLEKKDWSAWDYDSRPHPEIQEGRHVVVCGDWCAFKDGHPFQAGQAPVGSR